MLRAHLTFATILWLFVTAETSCAAEIQVPIAATDAKFVLPAYSGAHAVGVRSFSWIDRTRSRTGLSKDGGNREISVTVWYPAIKDYGQKPALYAPELETILAAIDTVPEDKQQFIEAHEALLNVSSNSIPGADIAPANGGWPVILFSPGGNVSRHFQTVLAEGVASRGFVLIAISHPYSSLDVAPESGFSMSLDWDLDNEDPQRADNNDNRLADILAEDAAFVLEQIRVMARSDHVLAGAMDLDRVGIAGHSRGGKTVGRSCSTNKEFRACAVIDNIGPARERETGINQPFLTLRSDWNENRVAELRDYLGRTGSVSHDVLLLQSNHFTCTDMPLFISELRVEGTDPVDGITACVRIIAGFFEEFLSATASESDNWIPEDLSKRISVRQFRMNARQ